MTRETLRYFGAYLKTRHRLLWGTAICVGIFSAAFALYRLPLKAVLYPAALCVVLGIGYILWDFRWKLRRHRMLEAYPRQSAAAMPPLPPSEKPLEADYQAIIDRLRQEIYGQNLEAMRRQRDATEYYSVWVHQIKTPIAAMRLLLQSEDSPLSRQLSGELLRIEDYVQMVMTYLRLESPGTDYVFREQPLDPILRAAVRRFSGEFIRRKIRLDFTPTETSVVTDEKWLRFVVEQLLSNALKYTPSGTVTIRMEPEKQLLIEDTGIGIVPEDLPRIFENGYTGYNGRTNQRASGIGLYLCRRICDSLSIGISAASEAGKGTCIRLDLRQYDLKKQ